MEDFEELRSSLTPREENAAIRIYQNTTAIACPACAEPFDDMVVCKEEPTSLTLESRMDVCVGTTPDGNAAIFTHEE